MAYTTATDVKTLLGLTSNSDDAILAILATAAQKIVESLTQRVFEASTNTIRYFDAIADVRGTTLKLDRDLASINTITNGDAALVGSTKYVTIPKDAPYYAVKLLASSGLSWTYSTDPENAIAISGKWAYSATAPDDIVQATKRLAAYLYKQRDAQVYDVTAMLDSGVITIPKGVPVDVMILLTPYRRRM